MNALESDKKKIGNYSSKIKIKNEKMKVTKRKKINITKNKQFK